LEVLHLIRSWRNRLAPINQIPPEILSLVPDFWDMNERDQDVITLTHVCRTWREMFTSRSALWTDFDCIDEDKTRVYLERSKSSPIRLQLARDGGLTPSDPFFEIIPHAIGRLKSLYIEGTPEYLKDIIAQLSHPAPLLETLLIHGGCESQPRRSPALTPTLFNRDISSLRELCLVSVLTELPWRSMVNLTLFVLAYMSPGEVSVTQVLDFLEGAPHLGEIQLHFTTLTSCTQDERLVSPVCLKRIEINSCGPSSLLLNHLLIPVGAELTIEAESLSSLIRDHLPRSLDNLRNFSNFTTIRLDLDRSNPGIQFSGPNGQVNTTTPASRTDPTCLALESLAQFDTSKIERLEIERGDPPSSESPCRALLPMKALRTLTLSQCNSPHTFIGALHPDMSSSEAVVCPKLEELTLMLRTDGKIFDIKRVTGMAAARASKGAKLKSVRIIGQDKFVRTDVLELEEHVLHVECGLEVDGANDGSGGSGGDKED
jgi:hypothetical protein